MGFFDKLKKITSNLFSGFTEADEAFFEELEETLIMADLGVDAATDAVEKLRTKVRKEHLQSQEAVREGLREILMAEMEVGDTAMKLDTKPSVCIFIGVNGVGKTTSIGKISKYLSQRGKSVLLAAGDTFRAAAREQLAVWGDRNQIEVIAQQGGDPAAVVFDAVSAGKARGTDVVIADTAGRLPTQINLMEELRRIRRAQDKAMTGAPHEAILVVDGTNGQNALTQVKAFDAAVGLTGLIVTKLDGTAKGGVLVAITQMRPENPLPIYFIGVGEAIDDLQPFNAVQFANALVGLDPNTPATAPE